MSLNFHVNISEQFTICECIRPCFEGSVNMDLQQDVDEGDIFLGYDFISKSSSVLKCFQIIANVGKVLRSFTKTLKMLQMLQRLYLAFKNVAETLKCCKCCRDFKMLRMLQSL